MKITNKLILSFLFLLTSLGVSAQVLSMFTWELGAGPTAHYVADIGPNAISSGVNCSKLPTGNGSPNGMAPGTTLLPTFCCASFCPTHPSCTTPVGVDCNFVVPEGTAGYFNRGSMTWGIDFCRRGSEVAANFFDRGTSLRFGSDCCGLVYIEYRVTQALSPFYEVIGSPNPGSGGFQAGTEGETVSNTGAGTWFRHTFIYDSVSGIGEVWRNDSPTPLWSSVSIGKARPGQSLYWVGAPPSYMIGRRCDGSGTGQTCFDNASVSAPAPVLPVILNVFTGTGNGFYTELQWSTITESNNSYFQLERYESKDSTWSLLGQVASKGNTNTGHAYSFIDPLPHAGKNIYLLRQFDVNGTQHPLRSVEVYFEGESDRIFNIHPNPSEGGGNVTLSYESPEAGLLQVEILDLQGKNLFTVTVESQIGMNDFTFSTETLCEGMYFCKIQSGNSESVKQFVIH